MTYRIDILPGAAADIRRNVGWMSRRFSAAAAAARWQSVVYAAISSLAKNPLRCPAADEAADLGIDLRMLLSGRRPHVFRILFSVQGDTVNVHHIRHAAQDRLTADDF